MLFGYPLAATQNNWFHECMCHALRTIHALADANKRYPAWPGVLPIAHRKTLRRRERLRGLLKAYYVAVRQLAKVERDFVLEALESENRIPELLSGAADCARKDELPLGVQEPIVELFKFAFDILGPRDLNVRGPHYAIIHKSLAAPMCPFCGTSYLNGPDGPQEDLDHYLARTIYPFAAVNLRNLVPMCHSCNSRHKLAADMVRRADRSRRVAFDPYNCSIVISVSVDDSKPFTGGIEDQQAWRVELIPETPEVKTWDEVFSVRERYRRDHLIPWYKSWVGTFVSFAQKSMGAYSDRRLIDMLRSYEESLEELGLCDRGFLRAAVFRMLRRHCEAGCREALDHLREWIYPPTVDTIAATPKSAPDGAPLDVADEHARPIPSVPPPIAEGVRLIDPAATTRGATALPSDPAPAFFRAGEMPDASEETMKSVSADIARLGAESQQTGERPRESKE
jgi:hypothetical protein